jgi:hypothetical protein
MSICGENVIPSCGCSIVEVSSSYWAGNGIKTRGKGKTASGGELGTRNLTT